MYYLVNTTRRYSLLLFSLPFNILVKYLNYY